MFRWCSYCQCFIGESEPRDDFSLTHGICISCKNKIKAHQQEPIENILPIKKFFHEIHDLIYQESDFPKEAVLAKAQALKVDSSDLLSGIMQPLLYEIGKLYSEGKVTVIHEHRFSTFIKELIVDFKRLESSKDQSNKSPEVLLTCANGNYHEFGVALIEMHLKKMSISVRSITPGLPPEHLVSYVQKLRPKIIGISVSMLEQIEEVRKFAKLVSQIENYSPLIIVGGFAIRKQGDEDKNLVYFNGSLFELVNYIKQELNVNTNKAS